MELFGIFLVISALTGLRTRFAALIQARKSGDKSGSSLRLFIFSSLWSLGALLLGASILIDKLNHPWTTSVRFVASMVFLLAIVREIGNAVAGYLRKRPAGGFRRLIFSSLWSLGALLIGVSILLEKLNHPWGAGAGVLGSALVLLAIVRRIANAAADYLRKKFPPGRKDMGMGTLVGWIAASTTADLVAFLLSLVLLFVAVNWLGPVSSWSGFTQVVARGATGALVGLLVGVAQVRVLSPYLAESRGWLWATIAGLAVSWGIQAMIALGTDLDSRQGDARTWIEFISNAIMGGIIGLFQGRVLQRWSVRAGWWPALSALAGAVGYVAIEILFPRLPKPGLSRLLGRVIVSDVVERAVTGVGLLWLQKERASPTSVISPMPPSPYVTNRPT